MDRPLTEVVRGVFVPVVLVVASQEAHDACLRSGTTPVTLFRDHLAPLKVAIQGPERNYQLKDFVLRFMELEDYTKSTESSDRDLYEFMMNSSAGVPSDPSGALAISRTGSMDTPWYANFRDRFLTTVRCPEHEFLELPVACVFVISTANKEATNAFVRLYKPTTPPKMFPDGFTDPNVAKFHLLLHENSDCPLATAEKNLGELRKTFGNDIHLLSLGGGVEGSEEGAKAPWKKHAKDFVETFVVRHLVPHMQGVIAKNNELVQASRKTFVSTMTSFMGLRAFGRTKPKEAPAAALPFSPMTTRLLADWMFTTQMYDSALTNYKNLISDLRSEKEESSAHIAGAQEMAALCLIMMEGVNVRKEAEQLLESAFDGYNRSRGDKAPYLAMRCAMFLSHALISKNAHKAAALMLEKAATFGPPLLSAILMEQAGLCYLSTTPPSVRRCGHGQVRAAERFRLVGLVEHALRCGLRAYRIYHPAGWQPIDDSLHSLLGRSSFLWSVGSSSKYSHDHQHSNNSQHAQQQTGDKLDVAAAREWALFFMGRLLVSCGQSNPQQASNLREYVHIHRTLPSSSPSSSSSSSLISAFCPPTLPIPLINRRSLQVLVTEYDPPASTFSETQWMGMTEKLLKARRTMPRSHSSLVSVIHEYIYVDVEVINPLPLPIQLTALQLLCHHTPPEGTGNDTHTGPGFEIEPFDLLLHPNEKKKLLLSVVARKVGHLKMLGIGFHLLGQVWGYRPFRDAEIDIKNNEDNHDNGDTVQLESSEKEKEKETENDNEKEKEERTPVMVEIVGGMPLLQATLEGLPRTALVGQRCEAVLRISNVGPEPLGSVSMVTSHSDFIALKEPSPPSFEPPSSSSPSSAPSPILPEEGADPSVMHLSFLSGLAAGESVSCPVFIRPSRTGSHSLRFLFYYEPLNKETKMPYRLLRISQEIVVKESLKIEAQVCSSSPTHLGWHTLRVLLHNHCSTAIRLSQLSTVSSNWDIAPLPSAKLVETHSESEMDDNTVVEPFCSRTLFFSVVPKGVVTTIDPLYTDLLLTNTEKVLDSSEWPYKHLLDAEMNLLLAIKAAEAASMRSNFPMIDLSSSTGDSTFSPRESWMREHARRDDDKDRELRLPLLMLWNTLDGKYVGQHHVFSLPYLSRPLTTQPLPLSLDSTAVPPSPMPPSLQSQQGASFNGFPLVYSLRAPSIVAHDFATQKMCIVHISVTLKNPLPIPCHVQISFPHEKERKGKLRELWMGATKQKWQLQGGEEKECVFQICIFESGVFEVGRFQLMLTQVAAVGGNGAGNGGRWSHQQNARESNTLSVYLPSHLVHVRPS